MYMYVYIHMSVTYEYIATNPYTCISYTAKCFFDGIQRYREEVCVCMYIYMSVTYEYIAT